MSDAPSSPVTSSVPWGSYRISLDQSIDRLWGLNLTPEQEPIRNILLYLRDAMRQNDLNQEGLANYPVRWAVVFVSSYGLDGSWAKVDPETIRATFILSPWRVHYYRRKMWEYLASKGIPDWACNDGWLDDVTSYVSQQLRGRARPPTRPVETLRKESIMPAAAGVKEKGDLRDLLIGIELPANIAAPLRQLYKKLSNYGVLPDDGRRVEAFLKRFGMFGGDWELVPFDQLEREYGLTPHKVGASNRSTWEWLHENGLSPIVNPEWLENARQQIRRFLNSGDGSEPEAEADVPAAPASRNDMASGNGAGGEAPATADVSQSDQDLFEQFLKYLHEYEEEHGSSDLNVTTIRYRFGLDDGSLVFRDDAMMEERFKAQRFTLSQRCYAVLTRLRARGLDPKIDGRWLHHYVDRITAGRTAHSTNDLPSPPAVHDGVSTPPPAPAANPSTSPPAEPGSAAPEEPVVQLQPQEAAESTARLHRWPDWRREREMLVRLESLDLQEQWMIRWYMGWDGTRQPKSYEYIAKVLRRDVQYVERAVKHICRMLFGSE